MQRRQFIALAGIAAIESSGLASASNTAKRRWQLDGVGSIGRVGVLTPDFDPVPESEMWAMAPQGVSIHTSRVAWARSDGPRAFTEPLRIDNAIEQLVELKPRAIVYAFTSSSYELGTEADSVLQTRLEKRAGGVSVILTCQAATEALRTLGANRIALIHPPWFREESNAKGREYFKGQGFEVVFSSRVAPERPFTEVPPAEVYEWVKTNVPRQAEAVFIGGNGLRAIGAIQSLEESIDRPVLTANQVVLWKALQVVSATAKLELRIRRNVGVGNSFHEKAGLCQERIALSL